MYQLARSRYAALVREAEVDRMVRGSGLERPGVVDRVRGRVLAWAVSVHRRLHDLDATVPRRGEAEASPR